VSADEVVCSICGQGWKQDPALMVTCPTCRAEPGRQCVRPSGHVLFGKGVHNARDIKAMEIIPGYGKCPGPPTTENV